MHQYDPSFVRQLHEERVAALKADYGHERAKPEPRALRMNRSLRLAWALSLNARAIWLIAVMVPICLVAVGVKTFAV